MARGHRILVIASHVRKDQTTYQELGAHCFDEREREAVKRRCLRRLEALGYAVTVTPATPVVAAA